ncbi:MAG: hypothetical protein EOM24_15075 [Chloroflexia bacterium]|nr:hypothetical protein [Chloroflexia bacterium]
MQHVHKWIRMSLGAFILSTSLIACQGQGTPSSGPNVVIMNAQGTPVGGTASGVVATPAATATPVPQPNLLENGDFASDWTDGWERDNGPVINGQSVVEVIPSSRGSSGNAVRLLHDGAGFLSVYQVIELTSPDVVISAEINPTAETPCGGFLKACTGMAGILIYLLQGTEGTPNERTIGSLGYLYPGTNDRLRQTSDATARYLFVPQGWQTVRLNLRQEIVNSLPGVELSAVKGVMVGVIVGSVGECDPGQCYAEVQATNLKIEPFK